MPPGDESTTPLPVPILLSESVIPGGGSGGLNVAVTDVAEVTVVVHVPVSLQPPSLQPAKVEPAAGIAVRNVNL